MGFFENIVFCGFATFCFFDEIAVSDYAIGCFGGAIELAEMPMNIEL